MQIVCMARRIAEASIDIHAPINLIWKIMTDLAAYGEWNPFIVRVVAPVGPPSVGMPLRLHVRWHNGRGVISPEIIARHEAPSADSEGRETATLAYRYTGWPHRLGLVRGTRVQTVEQVAGSLARYVTREEFHGWLKVLVPLASVQDGFERHAWALKARAEALARIS